MKSETLLAIYISTLISANIIATLKITNLWGFIVPAGFVAYAITFTITDIVSEVWGKGEAYKYVKAGFIANVFVIAMILVGYVMPPLTPEMQESYNTIMPMWRIVLASMVAYLVSQTHDVWAFHKWRELTRGRWLWLRNNASTTVSQLIDTAIFITLAFYGIVPDNILVYMIFWQWVWKIIVALIDTPFVYLFTYMFRRWNHV